MAGTILRKQKDKLIPEIERIIDQLRSTYDQVKNDTVTGDITLDIQVSKGGIHRSKISVSKII